MKIKRQLPQFKKRSTLIAVLSRQAGVVYHARNGVIEKVDEIEIPRPQYSDHEGSFVSRSSYGTQQSGSAHENQDKTLFQEFMKSMLASLKRHERERAVEDVYLFDAKPTLRQTLRMLPSNLKSKLRGVYAANYTKKNPFELLAMIAGGKMSAPSSL